MMSDQPDCADKPDNFVKEPPLQITLRVMQAFFSSPRFWVGCAAVIVILTVMGPFGTLASQGFAQRLVYWGTITLVTFPVAMSGAIYFGALIHQLGFPEALSRLMGGVIGGIPIGLLVLLINRYVAGFDTSSSEDLARLTGYTVVISAAIAILYYVVESRPQQTSSGEPVAAKPSVPSALQNQDKSPDIAFLKRLSKALGKDIISLQAQDHYVKVTTTRGSEMILLRLTDAERELEALEGGRVHRSWWLARKHVSALKRENEKWIAVLSNGNEVPVSRTFSKKVRNWSGR